MARNKSLSSAVLACAVLLASKAGAAGLFGADQGKLLLTAGFSTIEGAGGGALTPWALISGYGSNASFGANVHATGIQLRDFELNSLGVAVGMLDRLEFSASRQSVELQATDLDGVEFSQDIYGVKLRVAGAALYGQDSWLPQIAVGAQVKRHRGIASGSLSTPSLLSVRQLGASDEDGVDFYVSATRIDLARSLLINATLRYSKANQFGLLGFGGDRRDDYQPLIEATLSYLLRRQVALGVEYRQKSDNLTIDDEQAAWNAFVAWTPTRNFSLVAAYVNAGAILAPLTGREHDQDGAYMSLQVGF